MRQYIRRQGKWNYVYIGVILLIYTSCIPSILLSSKVSDETIQDIKTINSTILKNDSLWFEAIVVKESGEVIYYSRNSILQTITPKTVDRLTQFINKDDANRIKELFYKHNMKEIFVNRKTGIFYVLKTTKAIPFVTDYTESLVVQYCTDTSFCPRCYPSCGKVKRVIEPGWYVYVSQNESSWKPI